MLYALVAQKRTCLDLGSSRLVLSFPRPGLLQGLESLLAMQIALGQCKIL